MKAGHRAQRARLEDAQQQRETAETRRRAERLRGGVMGLWDRMTGKARRIREQNRIEAWECLRRDRAERDHLILDQMQQRRRLQDEIGHLRDRHRAERRDLDREIGRALAFEREPPDRRVRAG